MTRAAKRAAAAPLPNEAAMWKGTASVSRSTRPDTACASTKGNGVSRSFLQRTEHMVYMHGGHACGGGWGGGVGLLNGYLDPMLSPMNSTTAKVCTVIFSVVQLGVGDKQGRSAGELCDN